MNKKFRKSFLGFFFVCTLCGLLGCAGETSSSGGGNESSSSIVTITFVDESGNVLGTQKVDNTYYTATVYFEYSKEGYKCTFFDSEGTEVKSGSFTTTKNCKITVKTTPITYTVKFAKSTHSYGTISGTLPNDMTCTYDVEYTMPNNDLTYVYYSTTYKSVGWTATNSYSAVNARGEYSSGTSFKNLSKTDGTTVTLYACFTNDDGYALKFYTSGTSGSYTTVYADKGLIPTNSIPNAQSKTGYSFDGWYLSTDSSQTVIDFSTYEVTGNATFYAKFTAITYTITFVTEHGTAPEPVTYTYATSGSLSLTSSPYKLDNQTGYDFSGWCIGDNTYTSSYFYYSEAKDVTLTAKWTPWTATLKFNQNSTTEHPISGGYSMSDETLTWGEETTIKRVTFYSTSGWIFNGWNQSADGSGSTTWEDGGKIKWSGSTKGESITLYAQWKQSQVPLSIKLSAPTENDDIALSYDSTTGLFTATLSGATSFEWYIDGEKVSGQASASLSSAIFTEGVHSLMVCATLNGDLYSATRAVIVTVSE